MANARDFAKELNALIKKYIDGGCDPLYIARRVVRTTVGLARLRILLWRERAAP